MMNAAAGEREGLRRSRVRGGHLPVLDGVRGLAIILVLLYHQFESPAIDGWLYRIPRFGWCGVDLFFVLSGFLITGILLDSRERLHYFRNFYARRCLRIFPLYYAVLLLTVVLLPLVAPTDGSRLARILAPYAEAARHQGWLWSYLTNVGVAIEGWVFGPLAPFWSLAIEEHFYLLWPAVVFFCPPRRLMRVALLVMAGGVLARILLRASGADSLALYVLTPCRMEGLACGAFLAAFVRCGQGVERLVPPARILLIVLGGVIVWHVGSGGSVAPYSEAATLAGYSIFSLFFGSLLVLILASPPGRVLERIFSGSTLRVFGKYSYAIYLFHLPVQWAVLFAGYTRERFPELFGSPLPGQILFCLLCTGISFGCAWASWHLFERRFLALKRHFPSGVPLPPDRAD